MRRKRRVLLLLAAILLPSAALAGFGVRAVLREAEEAESQVRARAETAAAAARAALTAAATDEDLVPGAVRFRADGTGRILEPPEAAPAEDESASEDEGEAALWFQTSRDTDAAVREGRLEEALAALRGFIERAGASPMAAAALTALGALERRAGRNDAAREAWRRIADGHPRARDARGLRRAFAARLLLAETGEESAGALLDLWVDAAADHRSAADAATRTFIDAVRDRLRPRLAGDPDLAARAAEVEARHAAGLPVRALRAAFDRRLASWIAGGAAGSPVAVDVPVEAGTDGTTARWLVSAAPGGEGGFDGWFASADGVARAAFARPELAAWRDLGFGFALARVEAEPSGAAIASRALEGPWAGLRVDVAGESLESARARARRGFLLVAAFAAAALLVAAVAAVAAVRAVNREVEAASARESFVAAVTHELKAPLASIRLLAELLARGGVEAEKVREFGARTVGEADRLARLVAQILDLARIEKAGPRPDRHRRIDLAALARDTVASFAPQAEARGFRVRVEAADSVPPVDGDPDALGGALLNLLDNAVKYSDAPHEIVVEVGPGPSAGTAAFAVSDRGRGVPPQDAARIFEPFARGGDEETRDRPGVGLGLALVRAVAVAHGGRVDYEPRPGGGSVFRIVLPRAPGP